MHLYLVYNLKKNVKLSHQKQTGFLYFLLSYSTTVSSLPGTAAVELKDFPPFPRIRSDPWPRLVLLLETALMHTGTLYKSHWLQLLYLRWLMLSLFYLEIEFKATPYTVNSNTISNVWGREEKEMTSPSMSFLH